MSVSGRMWAELSHVAWADAEACAYTSPRRSRRLRALSARFAYRARELGFCLHGTEHIWGETPQTYHECSCGRRHETEADWKRLPSGGTMEDGDGGWLELRHCECGSTRAMPCPPPRRRASSFG